MHRTCAGDDAAVVAAADAWRAHLAQGCHGTSARREGHGERSSTTVGWTGTHATQRQQALAVEGRGS